jgi:hypothetical protein
LLLPTENELNRLPQIMPRIFAVSSAHARYHPYHISEAPPAVLFTLNARDDLIRPDDSSYGAKSPTVIRTFNSNFLRSRRETHGFDGAFSDLSPRTGKAPVHSLPTRVGSLADDGHSGRRRLKGSRSSSTSRHALTPRRTPKRTRAASSSAIATTTASPARHAERARNEREKA